MKKLRIAGYNIENVSFSPGQEPDGLDEEFATTFDVDFSISGRELSKMLGIQERVLDKKMKKLTSKEVLKILARNTKVQRDLEKLIEKEVRKEFNNPVSIEYIELDIDDFSSWEANLIPNTQEIKIFVTCTVLGEFIQ